MKIKNLTHLVFLFAMVLVVFLDLHVALAQESLFYQANNYYREGKYDLAVKDYEELIRSDLESGNLYYNLGNSYFKKGEFGLAVLNYERAKLFIPNDSDLKSNYEFTLHALNLEPESFGSRLQRLIYKIFEVMTVNSLIVFISLVYTVLIILFILNLFLDSLRRISRIIVFMLLILFILSAVSLVGRISYLDKSAIIISKEADVKFEPFDGATTYFKLSEGSKVEVIEKTGNWCKLKRLDGKTGWVNKSVLVLIAGNF